MECLSGVLKIGVIVLSTQKKTFQLKENFVSFFPSTCIIMCIDAKYSTSHLSSDDWEYCCLRETLEGKHLCVDLGYPLFVVLVFLGDNDSEVRKVTNEF